MCLYQISLYLKPTRCIKTLSSITKKKEWKKSKRANRIYIKALVFYGTGVYFLRILAVEYGLTFIIVLG